MLSKLKPEFEGKEASPETMKDCKSKLDKSHVQKPGVSKQKKTKKDKSRSKFLQSRKAEGYSGQELGRLG